MKRHVMIIALLLGLAVLHVVCVQKTTGAWNSMPKRDAENLLLPVPIMKISSVEFDALAADLYLIRSLIFIGKHLEARDISRLDRSEWAKFDALVTTAAGLDPCFSDPYYLGNAYLTWFADMPVEANTLLDTGIQCRTWDWVPPFLAGFNSYYFLKDYDKASGYLIEAARRPGATPTIGSIASRLAYKEHQTENALLFLEEMLKKTEDPIQRQNYEERIRFLKDVLYLEQAITVYKQKRGRKPVKLEDLVLLGMLKEIPTDPRGGKYFVDKEGRIRSTNEQIYNPHSKKSPEKKF